MASLSSDLRNKLERAIIDARDVAEAGAKAALETLAVHHHEPYPHQKAEERKLRVQLRAHARQLGDTQNTKGELRIGHLVHECAYEHWHRMLFARFLAENDLLIEPDSGMAVSLAEVEELAKAAKVDLWTYASRCAQQMLPRIFRPDDPLLQVALANEHRVKLERLLSGLDPVIFNSDDALGWVYQFWQSAEKDKVNKAGEKITGDTLPAVTQLFTEHYMVLFLLHNTLGAWWAGRKLSSIDLAEAQSETELRRKLALPGVEWEYLRFVRGEDGKGGPWRQAAGTFAGWPQRAADIKLLDPCCGSGHFLVAGFELLVCLRIAEEGLALPAAVDAVLRDNVFGLELDARCTQIAVFNLALATWKLTGYHPELPAPHVACTGNSPGGTRDQWMKILEGHGNHELRFFFGELYDLFRKAPTLGSLINPHRFFGSGMLNKKGMETLLRHLQTAIADDPRATPEKHEMGIAAQGLAKAAEMLADRYTLVVTNVPYLGRNKMDDILKEHLETQYPLGKADLATAFVLRCLEFCNTPGASSLFADASQSGRSGSAALVTPQNWLFLTTFTDLRETLLDRREWNIVVRLGEHAFESSAAAGAFAAMLTLSAETPTQTHIMAGIDVSAPRGQRPIYADEKSALLRGEQPVDIALVTQHLQLKNPDAAITFQEASGTILLSAFADSYQGSGVADINRFRVNFWELPRVVGDWVYHVSSPVGNGDFTGMHYATLFAGGKGEMSQHPLARIQGRPAWTKEGIACAWLGNLPVGRYLGTLFDNSAAAIIPRDHAFLPAIWCFCSSSSFREEVRKINQKTQVANATLVKVPFDLDHWQKVAEERYPNGLPEPESDDPTQWLFHGRPEESTAPLQVAVARLLGYRWPAELDDKMRLSRRARDLVNRCDELLPYADDDGIVCIPSVRGEEPAADRLLTLLTACGVKPDRNLDDWLRDNFFQEHCELFHHRPFVWHIWDGRKRDGFHALVNYHKLADGKNGKKVLESLTYSYLGEWINRQKDGVKRGEDGAEDCLAAATELQKRLVAIIEGEPSHDIFVRWKSIAEQPIGWEPDISDGVRLNIRPFLADDLPNGKSGAGVLRWKPKIKWDKDRGKEPKRHISEYPWFWGWDGKVNYVGGPLSEFTGERHNDCHYTTEFKRQARQKARANLDC